MTTTTENGPSPFKPLSLAKRTPTRNLAGHDSFRNKLIRRNKESTICDICAEDSLWLEATHIIDVAKRALLEEEYKANEELPVSVNDASNGLLLCPTCHCCFDLKEPVVQIGANGKIILSGVWETMNYRNLRNATVPWAHLIGRHKDYPTKELFKLALRTKPGAMKRIRELIEESEEVGVSGTNRIRELIVDESEECEAEVPLPKRSRKK